MLLKYVLVVIIFYFIVKTSGNLMRAMRGELDAGYHDPRFQDRSRSGQRGASASWSTPGSNEPSRSSTRHDADIEDAQWEDL